MRLNLVSNALGGVLILSVVGSANILSWDEALKAARLGLTKLTLEEKVDLVTGTGPAWENVVTLDFCVGNSPGNAKINFTGLCLQDGPLGARFATAVSAFAAGINVASTFNKDLMYLNGKYIGEQFKAVGAHVWLGPVMNLARTPEGGRNWEGAGADQYLSSISGVQQILGSQESGVIATAKHLIANDQEHGRIGGGSNLDDRTTREVYLAPFEAAVDAGVGAIMCGYNNFNHTNSCKNSHVFALAKQALGFKGMVMSDWWAVRPGEGIDAANAGLDLLMPGDTLYGGKNKTGTPWGEHLVHAVRMKIVPESRIDDMVTRVLASHYKMSQDRNYPKLNLSLNVQRPVHGEHIRRVGAESTVLLKHIGNVLPLKNSIKNIALIGSDAGPGKGPNFYLDRAGISGTLAMGWGSGTAEFPYLITPEDGFRSKAPNAKISVSFEDWDLEKAKITAKGADIAFVFVISDSGEGYNIVDDNVGDRNNITLWNNGDNLVNAVANANPNTIVVIHSVGAVNMSWISHPNIKAVLYAGLPGQESGNSLTDVIFGDVNPSGRLPFTINTKHDDYCCHVKYELFADVTYSEGLFIDYKWNDLRNIKPLFPFGHGLSYTTFQYLNLIATITSKTTSDPIVNVSLYVKNTGLYDGQEVVQLYVGLPTGYSAPIKQLRGFEKPLVKKGDSVLVSFELSFRDFAYWNVVLQKWVVPAGQFNIFVGASAGDIRLK
ncbi:hypothetical protein HK096_004481, partial [Nowakowskiella sp. JEL0078]